MLVFVGGVSGGYKTGRWLDERSVVVRTPGEQQCSWDVNSMSEQNRAMARTVIVRLTE